jgi:DNA-binding MarR family transcriptional regulator
MANRKQYTEAIMESMRLARHALAEQSLPPVEKTGSKSKKAHGAPITPSQWAILSMVLEQGELSNNEVAQGLAITSGAVTQLVDELVKKKYLTRESSEDDRRRLALKIAPKCRPLLIAMKAKAVQRTMAIFSGFTDDEMARYADLSRKFTESILQLKTAGQ